MEEGNQIDTLAAWTEFYAEMGFSLEELIKNRIRKSEKDLDDALTFVCTVINPKIKDLVIENFYSDYYKEFMTVFSVLILQCRKMKSSMIRYYDSHRADLTLDWKQGMYAMLLQSVVSVVDYHRIEDAKKVLSVLLQAEVTESVREQLLRIFSKSEPDLIELSNSYHALNFETISKERFRTIDNDESGEKFGCNFKEEVSNASLPFRMLAFDFEKLTKILRNEISVYSPTFVSVMIRLGIYLFLSEHCNPQLNSVFSYEEDSEDRQEGFALYNSISELGFSIYAYVYNWYFDRGANLVFNEELTDAINVFYDRVYSAIGKSEWKTMTHGRKRETHYYNYANFIGVSAIDRWYDTKAEFQPGVFDPDCFKQALLFTLNDYSISDQELCARTLSVCDSDGTINLGHSTIPAIALYRHAIFNYRFLRIGNALVDTIRKQNMRISELQDKVHSLSESNVSRETLSEISTEGISVEELQQSLDSALEENEKLRTQLSTKDTLCNRVSLEMQRQQSRYEKLLEEKENCIQELKEQLELGRDSTEAVSVNAFGVAEVESVEEMAEELNQYRGVFLGGDPNLVKKMAEYLPDWLLVDGYSGLPQPDRIQNKSIIVVYSDSLGHSKFNRAQSVAQQRGIPIVYVHGTNLRIMFNSMLCKVRKAFVCS